MRAATRVTAEQGLRGLTHRAVDREAGVSMGSCSAYYRTRAALQEGLAQYVASTVAADVDGPDRGAPRLPARRRPQGRADVTHVPALARRA